jgi:GNAT superfamily N-acetyltransferase
MEVVAASAKDADAVAAIFIAARRVAMPWLPELRNVGGVPRYFADHVIGEGEVLVVRRADAPVAFLALRGDMIEHLYVRPDAQRNGIGTALVAAAKARRSAGLGLWVFQRNHAARAFYARRGFAEVELTDGADNEEREPDVRLAWTPRPRS